MMIQLVNGNDVDHNNVSETIPNKEVLTGVFLKKRL
jgi:hypothetical protein